MGAVESCDAHLIAAFGLNDERIEGGEEEDEIDEPIGEDATAAAETELESFDWRQMREMHDLQKDKVIQEIIDFIENEKELPTKSESAGKSIEMQQFYRHRSCFKLSKQKILFRIWIKSDGTTDSLIVVGREQFEKIVHENHHDQKSSMRHVGSRKTFKALTRRYFAFGARAIVNKNVAKCAVCRLNNYPRGSAAKDGNQLSLEPGAEGSLDCCGPLGGVAQTAAGNRRWIVVFVDHHTRFCIARVVTSTADSEILKALVDVRDRMSGLPRRIFVDNALINPGSATAAYLEEHGVEIIHGLPYVSRCQSKCERVIGTLMRLVCKYHTDQPELPFHRIVAEAVLTINSTPSDGLGGELAPKDLFYARAPSNFVWHEAAREKGSGNDLLKAARLRSREVVMEEVKRYLKRSKLTAPTDYSNKVKVGQYAMKKRTSFPTSSPRKLCFKTIIDAFKVVAKVATNAYKVQSLITGKESIIPGDQLIKINSLTEDELKALCKEMEEVARRNADAAARKADETVERGRIRRSRRIAGRQPEVTVAALDSFFDEASE